MVQVSQVIVGVAYRIHSSLTTSSRTAAKASLNRRHLEIRRVKTTRRCEYWLAAVDQEPEQVIRFKYAPSFFPKICTRGAL
jgi:hypothetical protein